MRSTLLVIWRLRMSTEVRRFDSAAAWAMATSKYVVIPPLYRFSERYNDLSAALTAAS
jgi:hypothetical protein